MEDVLSVSMAQDYFVKGGKSIDWEETDSSEFISIKQHDAIQEILSCEVSIKLMRHVNGSYVDGSLVDCMVSLRRKLINEYESKYEKYIEYNDFY